MRKTTALTSGAVADALSTMPTDLGSPVSAGKPVGGPKRKPNNEAELVEMTIQRGFRWLRFPRKLENQFVIEMPRSRASASLPVYLLVIVAANLFLLGDWIMVPDVFGLALVLRPGLIMPFALLIMALSAMSVSMRVREKLLLFLDWLAAGVHATLCIKSDSALAQMYLVGMSVIMLYATSHLRTRFWMAALSSTGVMAIFILALFQFDDIQWPVAISMGLMMLSSAIFTLYNLYGLEHEERLNFLMTLRHQRMQSNLRKTNRLLERVSRVDALTQVANRRHFDQFLGHVWERARRDGAAVTLLMLDVDCFKAYNDHFGHPKGDQCLVDVARSVYSSLRKPGDLLARYGGEEFIAVLSKADLTQGQAAAERVRQAIQALRIEHPKSVVDPWVTVSVGVATLKANAPGASTQTLMAMADEALYEAKRQGRNRVVCNPVNDKGESA